MPAVGQDLLDVPFPQMLTKLALAIAESQRELDKESLETVRALAEESVEAVTEVRQTLDASGKVVKSEPVRERMSLVEYGLNATFYQFAEAILEVKMAISMKNATELTGSPGYKRGWGAFATPVTGKYTQSYSYSVDGASLIRAVLKPIPPPSRAQPLITTTRQPS